MTDSKLCPHGYDPRFVHCNRCDDPAFDAAKQPHAVLHKVSIGGVSESLFQASIRVLAEIDAALGIPEDGCNSTAQTLQVIRQMKEENARLKRGEFICSRCYLRKDGESDDVITF